LEAEANEKLESVMGQILQAGLDKSENDKDLKQKENLASLQRIFPGTMGFGQRLICP
jgi:structural maintenance of chromosome 1